MQAQITGHGSSSGEAVNIGLKRTTSARLEIELPRGTVLVSAAPGFQDMVVAGVRGRNSGPNDPTYSPTSNIVLDDDEQQWFLVEAYCLDIHGESPESGSTLTVGGIAAPEVLAVLDTAAQMVNIPSIQAIQIAVWALVQDPSRAGIQARIPTDDDDFSQARGLLEASGVDPASMRVFQ